MSGRSDVSAPGTSPGRGGQHGLSPAPRRGTLLVTVAVLVAVTVAILVLRGGQRPRPATRAERPASAAVSGRRRAIASSPGTAIGPALFGPGSCVAFGPTHGDNHRTVFLDAGHGGLDPGAVGTTTGGTVIDEAGVNLRIELDAMTLLRARGYRVVVSRTRASTVIRLTRADMSGRLLTVQGVHDDVAARDVCANMARADILIGIYMNAGSAANAGCMTAYDPDRQFSAENLRLATLVQRDVLEAMTARGLAIP